jgi:hypothetical protein
MTLRQFNLIQRRDERQAVKFRDSLGRKGVLISWYWDPEPDPKAPWIARVSCDEVPETVEARSFHRCSAIVAAIVKMDELRPSEIARKAQRAARRGARTVDSDAADDC